MSESTAEVMLAQEEAVLRRGAGARKGVEAAFGMGGETEGTLVLTDRRLVYVHGREKEVDLRVGAFSKKKLFFADVEDLDSMEMDSESFEIPFSSIVSVTGRKGPAVAPRLEAKWKDHGETRAAEFIQQVTGASRKKNLNDWAPVVEKLRTNKLELVRLPPSPGRDTLEGRILGALGDMQEKGLFTIEEEVETRYSLDLDPELVESACERLEGSGLIVKVAPRGDGSFYRKVSPLGDDDLSA